MELATLEPKDLAGFIGSHLQSEGIDVTLVGGTCVSIYSDNLYQSDDLDFVDRSYTAPRKLKAAMEKIGFKQKGRCYEHPDCRYLVEFPPGPLAIGNDPVNNWVFIETPLGTFSLISVTDCVKDRLAAFMHWGDREALKQAVWVARDQSDQCDLNEIEQWALREGGQAEFQEFSEILNSGGF